MDQHLGASITLSFSIVVIFAIILYQPEEPPLPRSETGHAAAPRPPDPSTTSPLPEPTPGEPLVEPIALSDRVAPAHPPQLEEKARSKVTGASTSRRPETLVQASRGRRGPSIVTTATASARVPDERANPRREAGARATIAVRPEPDPGPVPGPRPPHEAFTLSRPGETLRDVAVRVYGSSDAIETLWRLNRDLIGRDDDALPSGTLLRTP